MKVRIIGGTYGWRDESMRVHPVAAGGTCEVSEAEGARLCSLGIAEVMGASEEKPEKAEPTAEPAETHFDKETLQDMKLPGLRILCENHGAENPRKMTKAECIAFLLGEDNEGEGLPDAGGAGEIII